MNQQLANTKHCLKATKHAAAEREHANNRNIEELTEFLRGTFLDTFNLQCIGGQSTDAASGSGTRRPYQAYSSTTGLQDDKGFIRLFILIVDTFHVFMILEVY